MVNISFFGSIIPIKGLENLVEVASKIKSENFIINIYGDIPNDDFNWYIEKIRGLIKKNNLSDKIIFNGWKEDTSPYFKKSDIVILTSKSEGLPRVILEAMAHSKPVVGFDVGGVKSLIQNNINGYLIDHGDNNKFAEKLTQLTLSSSLREDLGREGLKIAQNNFSAEKVKEKLLKVFR